VPPEHRATRASRPPWAAALIAIGLLAAVARAEDPSVRLRVEWGGGSERRWQGTLSVSEGVVTAPQALGIEADEPGSMWVDDDHLVLGARSTRAYDGVDITVRAPLDAKLIVQLSAADEPDARHTAEVPLRAVLDQYHSSQLDQKGNHLLVRRVPGDKFKLSFARTSLVFDPGEVFALEVRPQLFGVGSGTRLRLQARLTAPRSTRPLWSDEHEFNAPEGGTMPAVPLAVKMPEHEGVYDLVLTATRRSLQERLSLRPTVDERHVQLIVVSSERPAIAPHTPLEVLLEIDPANPAWWERLGNLPLMPGWRRGPLGNGDLAPWQHPLGSLVQLGPGGREPNISWEAYPLPISKPGHAHIVEVEYPSDVPQSLGISLVEPNVTGAVMPIGLDSGVYLPSEAAESTPVMARHRLVFWPRTSWPLLLMTNRRQGARAVYGRIRLLGPRQSAFTTLAREPVAGRLPRAFPPDARPAGRLLAGYFDRPLFPENFSGSQAFDSWSAPSGRALDDWNTFQEGANRLVEYVNYVGYNGLMMSVLSDGSTIYPSTQLEPTPRYEDGVLLSSGQDPLRKDVLELLFRLFDREQLQLIPALQFSAPLADLEAVKRHGGPSTVGIDLIGVDGGAWTSQHEARQGLAPYYNPLNPRVQEAMLAVVREVADRYATHPSFTGLALQLSADGYAQLPGVEWGFDEQTLARFQLESQVDLGADPGVREAAQLLTGKHRAAWVAWRCQTLARFYQRLQTELSAAHPGAKLYLATADLFNRPELSQELRPSLPKNALVEDALRNVGIDPELYRQRPNIVLLRAQRIAPLSALPMQAVNLELNQSPELDRIFYNPGSSGSLFFHEPQEARLPSFDAKSPFRNTYLRLVSQPSPGGRQNRRRFAHALATLDAQAMFDGGWLLPLGQEDELRDLIDVYRQLPPLTFETIAGASQPVTVRTCVSDNHTYFYVVNDSPWSATLKLAVSGAEGSTPERLGNGSSLPEPAVETDGISWTVELAPYEIVAGTFPSGAVQLSNPQVKLQTQVVESLDLRIKDLWARAATLKHPPPCEQPANANLEAAANSDGTLVGWTLGEQAGGRARVDAAEHHGGKQSVRLTAGTNGVTLSGTAIATPQTGRLSASVWLRVADESKQPPLQLGIHGQWAGADYTRSARLGLGSPQKLHAGWSQFLFQVRDLPVDGLTKLQVRFDLVGPGEIWIDDVELFDLDFTDNERLELSKTITLAEYKRKSNEWGDCLRLLEGYWPRFLVANVPLTRDPLAERPRRPPLAPSTIRGGEEKRGVMERIRGSMPDIYFWR
jgi:glycosyl hydrolase family 10